MNAQASYRDPAGYRRTPDEDHDRDSPHEGTVSDIADRRFAALLAASSLRSSEAQKYQELVGEDLARRLVADARALNEAELDILPWEEGHDDEAHDAEPESADSQISRPLKPTESDFVGWARRYNRKIALIDSLSGLVSMVVAVETTGLATLAATWIPHAPFVALSAAVGATVWPTLIGLAQGYRPSDVGVGMGDLRAVARAGSQVAVATVLMAIAGATGVVTGSPGLLPLTQTVLIATPSAFLLSFLGRLIARRWLRRQQRAQKGLRRVVVVGTSDAARALLERIHREPYSGMKVVGMCLPSHELPQAGIAGLPVLGDLSQVRSVAQKYRIDAVTVTSDGVTRGNYLRELNWSLEGTGVGMLIDPGVVEVASPRMHIRPAIGIPFLEVDQPQFYGWPRLIKRTTDIIVAGIALVAVAPVLLAIAIVIKVEDGGPVLFRQTRIGRGGRPFTLYKFRSTVTDAEAQMADLIRGSESKGALFKLSYDPRVTRVGRFLRDFSFDELPNLFNVLNGTMSLVGPRPYLPNEIGRMPREALRRSLVTPGMTGLWQISGRSSLEGDDAIRLDLRYVENWSLALDLLILGKTVTAVLRRW